MTSLALVVDDDPVARLVLCHMLRRRGWSVDEADDVPEARTSLRGPAYDLVVSDFHLPSGTGIDVLAAAEEVPVTPVFVLVTGVIESSSLTAPARAPVSARLTKPVSSLALDAVLQRLFPGSGP